MKELVRPNSVGGSPLVRQYLQGSPSTQAFFNGSPYLLDTYRAKLLELNRRFDPSARETAAAALRPVSDLGRERLARFVAEGGAMVTTGQQAGFLTGPLYTIHKAASALALARHLEDRLGLLVLPVFWVASEDHDWAEVNHAYLVDRKGGLRRFALDSADDRPLPMAERPLEGELETLCEEISQTVGATRNNAKLVERILAVYQTPGASVARAFREALQVIFEGTELLIADAADPAIKRASVGVLRTALVDAQHHEDVLARRSHEIEAAGFQAQVNILPGSTNVFHHSEAGRHRLYRRGTGYAIREQRRFVEGSDLLGSLEEEPGRFSPNVFLRPIVESHVFPSLAYVGGPGEIAYFAQVTALFAEYGMVPPAVVPRFSALVVEPAIDRVLEETGLNVDDLAVPREQLVERLAQAEVPPPVRGALQAIRENLAADFERLIDQAVELDANLGGALGAVRNRELLLMAVAERKIVRAIKQGDRVAHQQLDRILNALRPEGTAQERVLNLLPYLGRYGRHFLRELDRSIRESWRLPE